jgi:ribA/ribD-fused uncharacterized protein
VLDCQFFDFVRHSKPPWQFFFLWFSKSKKKMRITDQYVFFYGTFDYCSNFHPSPFIVDGVTYSCGEQWIMAQKAALFADKEAHAKIMSTKDPKIMKVWGRKVKNFEESRWESLRGDIAFRGLLEKFRQNPELKRRLVATGSKEIAEASSTDLIWGVGLSENNPKILSKANWRGKNLLGQTLMRVRAHLVA